MKLFNSMSRKKEEFVPITPGEVKMYCCGPTVYNYIHVGNARPMILYDSFAVRLEETDFFTVFESKAYTVSLAGCRIEDCYVGNLNSGFFFNDATRLVQGRNRLLMFLNQVDTFNNDLAGRQDILNFTAFTFIFTG